MIDLYAFPTPNSIKVPILLEELGAQYRYHAVNVRAGEQKTPEHLARNANGKVPVIVDQDGPGGQPITVVESGAILLYLGAAYHLARVRFAPHLRRSVNKRTISKADSATEPARHPFQASSPLRS